MANRPRGPLITSVSRKREIVHDFAPSGVLLTLAIATIADCLVVPVPRPEVQQPPPPQANRAMLEASPSPFAQTDWQNPVRRVARAQPDPGGSLLNVTLPVVDLNGGRSDLSFPVDPWVKRQPITPDVQQRAASLSAVAVVAPFAQQHWPNPERRLAVAPQLNWRVVADRVPDPPFSQSDWPHAPRRRTVQQGDQPPVSQALTVPAPVPFNLTEAQIVFRQESLDAHVLVTLVYEPTSAPPFKQTEWPPRVGKRNIEVPALPSALTGPLNTPVTLPFAEYEWPVVRRTARFQETPQPNLQNTLYVVPTPPFAQRHWPTPPPRVGRFDYNLPNLLGTLPPPPIPFALNDWPNPVRKKAPHFDQWGQSLQHTTLFVENVKPFNQNDWNVAFLFAPRPEYPFVSYQPKIVVEGIGLIGLQPPTYVVGPMTTTAAIKAPMSAAGIGLDGEMTHFVVLDGRIADTQGFEGPV